MISTYGEWIAIRLSSHHQHDTRGVGVDHSLPLHPARYPVFTPVRPFQITSQLPGGYNHCPALFCKLANYVQAYPLGGSAVNRPVWRVLSSRGLGLWFAFLWVASRSDAGCPLGGADDCAAPSDWGWRSRFGSSEPRPPPFSASRGGWNCLRALYPFRIWGNGRGRNASSPRIQELSVPFGPSLRVVQLTDLHAGIFMTREEIRRYADQAIALQPDLFVLTGDFISTSVAFLPGCLEEMAHVQARYGTFATLGNHEHWYGGVSELQTIFQKCRIPLLHNAHPVIQTEQGPFAVAGIDDMRSGRPDLDEAVAGLDSSVPTILLSHRPEIFPRAAEGELDQDGFSSETLSSGSSEEGLL